MVLCAADLPLAAIRSQIAGALDILIHLGRLRDHTRHVLSIMEVGNYVDGEIELRELYSFREAERQTSLGRVEGRLEQTGMLRSTGKLRAAGIEL